MDFDFRKFEKAVFEQVRYAMRRNPGIHADDILEAALIGAVKAHQSFTRSKGKKRTWIVFKVKKELLTLKRNEAIRIRRFTLMETESLDTLPAKDAAIAFEWDKFPVDLRKVMKYALRIPLKERRKINPDNPNSGECYRHLLKKYLKRKGKKLQEIRQMFKSIKEVL